MSILEKLFYCEAGGESLGDSTTTPDDAACNFFHRKLLDEINALLPPDDLEKQSHFYGLVGGLLQAQGEKEYQRGIRFAVHFMAEAMQPRPKSHKDLETLYDKLTR